MILKSENQQLNKLNQNLKNEIDSLKSQMTQINAKLKTEDKHFQTKIGIL